MSKLFVSGRTLMSASIQFMTTKRETGSKKQTKAGSHKISRLYHHQRLSVTDIAQSGATEGSGSTGSCRTKPIRSRATLFRVGKSSKSKPTNSTDAEPSSKDPASQNISMSSASRENYQVKSNAKPRRKTNKCRAASSLSAACQNHGKTIPSTSTPSLSKRQASVKVLSHQVQGCPKAKEKRKTVTKRHHVASGENLNASSSSDRHLRCTRRAAKTVSYTIRCSQREPKKSSNKDSGMSKSSTSPSVSRAMWIGQSVSPRAHLIQFPKASLLKLTRRAATMSIRADSSAADDSVPSTNSDTAEGGGEAASPGEESLGPASYIPVTSTSNITWYKSESKPRFKKISCGGVVRTRIVRKKKMACFADGINSRMTQKGIYNSTMNPCDGGKLNASQAISVVFNDSNRSIDLDSSKGRNHHAETDAATPGNAAFSLASSSELMKSCSASDPSKDLATSMSDSKTNSQRRRASATGGDGVGHAGRQKVHVTRIRRSSARPPTNANNNADSPDNDDEDENDDIDEKRRGSQKKRKTGDEDSEIDETADGSSRETPESSEENDSSSRSSSGTEPVIEPEEPNRKQELQSKVVKGVKKPLKGKVGNEFKKTPMPKCPRFQGWDNGTEIGEHTMTRLPVESDLTTQLTKRAKLNIWESKGRPHNIFSFAGSPITLVRAEREDLKSYLARHSIDEFVQHLTSSVLTKHKDDSAVDTLIEQGEHFKQTLKFEQDTDAFLKYVFRELADQPIAFPSVTKTRNIEPEDAISPDSHTPVGRRSCKKSFDIVIGMPGLVYEPRLSGRLSGRWDMDHRNTLQVGSDSRPYFGTIRTDTSRWMQN